MMTGFEWCFSSVIKSSTRHTPLKLECHVLITLLRRTSIPIIGQFLNFIIPPNKISAPLSRGVGSLATKFRSLGRCACLPHLQCVDFYPRLIDTGRSGFDIFELLRINVLRMTQPRHLAGIFQFEDLVLRHAK